MNNLEPIIILEPGGRRPDLYADIPVPVLQVPSGKEGKPGGLPNFRKEEEKEQYNLNVMGKRKKRGWFWPASGRRQISSTNFIRNQL